MTAPVDTTAQSTAQSIGPSVSQAGQAVPSRVSSSQAFSAQSEPSTAGPAEVPWRGLLAGELEMDGFASTQSSTRSPPPHDAVLLFLAHETVGGLTGHRLPFWVGDVRSRKKKKCSRPSRTVGVCTNGGACRQSILQCCVWCRFSNRTHPQAFPQIFPTQIQGERSRPRMHVRIRLPSSRYRSTPHKPSTEVPAPSFVLADLLALCSLPT